MADGAAHCSRPIARTAAAAVPGELDKFLVTEMCLRHLQRLDRTLTEHTQDILKCSAHCARYWPLSTVEDSRTVRPSPSFDHSYCKHSNADPHRSLRRFPTMPVLTTNASDEGEDHRQGRERQLGEVTKAKSSMERSHINSMVARHPTISCMVDEGSRISTHCAVSILVECVLTKSVSRLTCRQSTSTAYSSGSTLVG